MSCPLGSLTWPVTTGLGGLIIGFVLGYLSRGQSSNKTRKTGDSVEIYVGNLSYDMTDTQLQQEFERFGTVVSARIITNRFSQKSKGFGFVEMPNRNEAEAAIKGLHEKEVLGRRLRINEAKNKSRD